MTDLIDLELFVSDAPTGRALVLPLSDGQWRSLLEDGHRHVDAGDHRRLRDLAELTRFQANAGQTLTSLTEDGRRLTVVGLGSVATTVALREAVATAMSELPDGSAFEWSVVVPPRDPGGADVAELLRAAAEGALLGGYRFGPKRGAKVEAPGPCTLVTGLTGSEATAIAARARALCEGVVLARDLINTPAQDLGPQELSDAAVAVAERHGMRARVLRGAEVEEHEFRLVAAVGRAADRPATVTIIEGGPEGADPVIGVVGKGVVFDTGGLDLKTGGSMQLMRKDMGGAGTVIGALEAFGRLGGDTPFLAVIPAAENAIGPAAMRPGDVLRSMDGLTVEIGNTDAEGRLLLADGLTWARRQGVPRLLDVATLTGAARVALGPDFPALFGNDEALVEDLRRRSIEHDEELWRMPLVDRYESWIDSPFADVNNAGSDRRAGAITAALFLRRFARDTPWAHVDLYAWEDRGRPGTPRGANGMEVRTVAEALAGAGGLASAQS
ncbi:MAG: leucyl aminopeptidase family protein [Planctomycetota bacterium]|jgi:leucyl aminopeptidase